MLDPKEFRNIIHQDFTEVTSQEFLANLKKYCPEIFEGDNYPNVTENLNNLAKLYQSQGRYAEAEPLYQQALDIAEKGFFGLSYAMDGVIKNETFIETDIAAIFVNMLHCNEITTSCRLSSKFSFRPYSHETFWQ